MTWDQDTAQALRVTGARAADIADTARWKRQHPEHAAATQRAVEARARERHAYGTCTCGQPLSRGNTTGTCKACVMAAAPRCAACGTRTGRHGTTGLCLTCLDRHELAMTQTTVDLWLDGLTAREVGFWVGKTPDAVKATIHALRAAGHPIPRRRRGQHGPGAPASWETPPPDRILIRRGDVARGVAATRQRTTA